jgi:ribonuclease R
MPKEFPIKKDPMLEREKKKYKNPVASREYILAYLTFLNRPATQAELLKKFAKNNTNNTLEYRLKAMVRDAQIMQDRARNYVMIDKVKLVKGEIRFNKEKNYEIYTESQQVVPLSSRFYSMVFPGDVVLVKIPEDKNKYQASANLIEVTSRKHTKVTGLLAERNGVKIIEPTLKVFRSDVIVDCNNSIAAKTGDYVTADIISYPSFKNSCCVASIIKILGKDSSVGIESQVAISAHGLPHIWPDAVYDEVMQLPVETSKADLSGRLDLRDLPFVTIDGDDSRDFDDAVYAVQQPDGGFILYVAIADVDHYVRKGSALDQAAFERATSVYFPREVIPMLPEVLSNNLCSLVANKDRLTLVAKMHIDEHGVCQKSSFHKAVIKSHARLTYGKVFAMLSGKEEIPSWLGQPLNDVENLFQKLHKQRSLRGCIEFDTKEYKCIFDKNGHISNIVTISRNIAHKIIEECMLVANSSAAQFIAKKNMPVLYRAHAEPEAKKIARLQAFLMTLNVKFDKNQKSQSKLFNKIMLDVKDESYANIVNTMILRTMSQAVYQTNNIGHFGLCYEAYLHFTSPIRRYPDLVAHRVIKNILAEDASPAYTKNESDNVGLHCSMAERRADDASRAVMSWLQCIYMQDKVGEIYPGTISSVTSFGVFVELDNMGIDGLIHISSLKSDYYNFDQDSNRLIGEKTNKYYVLGQKVKIKVLNVDVNSKFIDFKMLS